MTILIFIHSIFRWLVVITLFTSLYTAWRGYRNNQVFTKKIDALRHWTATIAHVQLILGFILITRSQFSTYFWKNMPQSYEASQPVFYGLIHPLMMLLAITLLTIGSAKAKRAITDQQKYRTMLAWFTIATIVLFIAIPWPFSPFSSRPLIPNL